VEPVAGQVAGRANAAMRTGATIIHHGGWGQSVGRGFPQAGAWRLPKHPPMNGDDATEHRHDAAPAWTQLLMLT
jgi:hypothetical protein